MNTHRKRNKDFTRRVLTVVKNIPHGRIATYSAVARMAGNPSAWRAVGNIMRSCGVLSIPCHRVVNSSGLVGGYNGLAVKIELLRHEGIRVFGKKILRFHELKWQKDDRSQCS